MIDRPSTEEILFGVARFLEEDVRPHITDKALSFRVLVAANMVRVSGLEATHGVALRAGQVARLRDLIDAVSNQAQADDSPASAPADAARPPAEVGALRETLARAIRETSLDEATFRGLADGLFELALREVMLTNPRFDVMYAGE